LRGLAQPLRAQLHVGREGLTPGVHSALEDLFRGRELVKGRLLRSCPETAAGVAAVLAGEAGAALVGVIGNTFVLYRANPELKERIELAPAGPPGTGNRSSAAAPPNRTGQAFRGRSAKQ
jgi:RNA-binding protein